MLRESAATEAQKTGSQDLAELGQALLGAQQVGVERVGARKASIETVRGCAGVLVHPAVVHLFYVISSVPGPVVPALRAIQPLTVSGSLSNSRAISSSERPSACRRTASAWRLR